ncbi:MAG: lysine--tRNA ligase [Desulfurella sp.]|uniref:lysine--tRNA ligase n=1 Tax=Desulfurella sp. TaxID=1962857 RepID=UPI000CBE1200|nr:lysine--tRNA ligase [Desulfurella sp.]PMP87157.1 MAG: lysine--tRNA ligase [Desulfurella sp.]HEX13087.1 lysine--tRNA ligase [Desulfurella acetivorans]
MIEEENKLIKRRIEKLEEIKALGIDPYYNGFSPEYFLNDILNKYKDIDSEKLKSINTNFKIAGRIISIRDFGKAAFLKLKDVSGTLQVYCQKNVLGEQYALYKKLDVGDIIGIEGNVFKTKTQEVTINATKLHLLTKSIRPLPEKFHGLQDKELRYRQRYVDLIVNDDVRETFFKRSKIIALIREFMINNKFLEVETPMLHKLVGGAAAKPFVTHLNALDIDMYLRIAPELYLKRLVVGGLERVFEINRNFRNEGMDLKHNPEFTMMEFYCAYKEYNFLLDFTEELFDYLLNNLDLGKKITYGGLEIDFSRPFKRIKFIDALKEIGELTDDIISDKDQCLKLALQLEKKVDENTTHAKILAELFDALVEPKLINPTFVTHYPVEISPLAKKNKQDPLFTDRFELFIANMEIANGFSELNDPFDQKERFIKQLEERNKGDEEASMYDEDYIVALEYGLAPTAGEGIGIDRLVMLLTNNTSIRDVILFPLMK